MYARNVTLQLKANTAPEFTRTLETDVLPVLRKQNGFKDEITFLAADGAEAVAISLWDRKENADNYSRDTYPEVLKRLAKVVEGTPKVENYEVANSTFHKIAARIANKAALALGAGPELEQQPKLILPINGDAARGIHLPDLAVHYDGASCHQAERLRGREYNPESLSEAENLQPQLVIRARVTASFTAIARVRHHRREIARCCSNSAGARTSPRKLLRPALAKNVRQVCRNTGRRQLQVCVKAAEGDSGFLVALTIHNVKIVVVEEFAPVGCDTVLTDLLCVLHRPICLFLHLAIG